MSSGKADRIRADLDRAGLGRIDPRTSTLDASAPAIGPPLGVAHPKRSEAIRHGSGLALGPPCSWATLLARPGLIALKSDQTWA